MVSDIVSHAYVYVLEQCTCVTHVQDCTVSEF